jgi:hypothetical protein
MKRSYTSGDHEKGWASTERAAGYAALCAFGCFWCVRLWLWANAPRLPEDAAGITMPLQGGGAIFYVTYNLDWVLTALIWFSAVAFGCAVLIDFYVDPFHRRDR